MQSSTTVSTPAESGSSRSNFTPKNKPNTRSTSPKGRSKYATKSRGKSKTPAKAKTPSNVYTSVCCSAPAKKKPCVAVNKKDALTQTLGKFRCTACGKRAKVTVSKAKNIEVITVPTSNGVGTMSYGEEVPLG